jgi:hypothetical protein
LAVCQAIDRLTTHLAENSTSAVVLAAKTTAAGLGVMEDMVLLADEVATLLTEGAPRRARTRLAPRWISGALAYTLHTEVMAGRTQLLGRLSDYLSYVVLAPYIGPERAVQTVAEAATAAPLREMETEPGIETVDSADAVPLAPPIRALGEVREHDAGEQRDDDHDDQRDLAGADDPTDLDLAEIEDREQRDEHRQRHPSSGARQLSL